MQDIIVYCIVAAAAVYIARVLWSSLAGSKGCGGCGKSACATTKKPESQNLIQISLGDKPNQ
jgi:hypothetical protein